MQQPVLVAVDGSDKDARAIAVGTAIANLAESDLHFVRVTESAPKHLAGTVAAPGLQDAVETGARQAESELADVVAAVPPRGAHVVTSAVLRGRDVADELIRHAVERKALMLVLATRAPGMAARALIGSVADRVVRESPRPVVIAPPGTAFMGGKQVTVARVLVPLDGSTLALRSLEFLIDLPHAPELEYVLIEVVAAKHDEPASLARLQASANWLRSRGAKSVEVLVVEAADAGAAILSAVREVLPDAIAMSTRGSGGLGRMVLGSVADTVVRGSELSVLLLTPKMLGES
jgi:nucleotide-binding universal stress UspA family protein